MEANYFTILWWFCHTLTWNQPWVYMCLPSWTPLPPPSSTRPSELFQCNGFECPVSCIKLGLVICFTYGNTHVSMLFFQITHPCLLPQSPKIYSLYLCLFSCLAHKVVITIFLNSIYMCVCVNIQYWCFSFWLLHSVYLGFSFIHLIRTDSNVFLFLAE